MLRTNLIQTNECYFNKLIEECAMEISQNFERTCLKAKYDLQKLLKIDLVFISVEK